LRTLSMLPTFFFRPDGAGAESDGGPIDLALIGCRRPACAD